MRVAIISDMHGNCFALDHVLQALQRETIDQIVCLGDAIQGGPQPAETTARLRELGCPIVMGNADDWMLTHSDGQVQYKKDYLEQLATRNRTNTAITNEDVKLRMYGDAAVVTGVSVQSGIGDGKPFTGKFRFTRMWVVKDGKWVMTASHSSRVAP